MREHSEDVLLIGGWKETSMVDVLESVSFTLWLSYCNFRCPWCANSRLARGLEVRRATVDEIVSAVSRARAFVDYFHVTGGEPTLQYRRLEKLFERVKTEVGLPLSLDTNASIPSALEHLLRSVDVEHVAVDVKAPLDDPMLYSQVVGLPAKVAEKVVNDVRRGIAIAGRHARFLELRTLLVPGLLEPAHLERIARQLSEMELSAQRIAYVVQQFIPYEGVPEEYRGKPKTPRDVVASTAKRVAEILPGKFEVWYRTIEEGAVRVR
ncbi:anaerobic ribonucleoside-triphosphate reductase activating protein [Thermofilum pendens]|uniref:Anaerobic ribonucleoside-triphosphate reductase activating protein n=1 Tax=Thermofilum pendens (strain DSM 2475 / Hrk 5) TaxID=368408 RepID=A1RYH2_THEPD|nr:anaerobic ribonucleoside-triphosphate reductase activating protein [Thermofilum pendens]ABL78252.1 anaerobic ribonucleoside-triphosphate reductase activating protein [Thermofilum pendens Hrk 5]